MPFCGHSLLPQPCCRSPFAVVSLNPWFWEVSEITHPGRPPFRSRRRRITRRFQGSVRGASRVTSNRLSLITASAVARTNWFARSWLASRTRSRSFPLSLGSGSRSAGSLLGGRSSVTRTLAPFRFSGTAPLITRLLLGSRSFSSPARVSFTSAGSCGSRSAGVAQKQEHFQVLQALVGQGDGAVAIHGVEQPEGDGVDLPFGDVGFQGQVGFAERLRQSGAECLLEQARGGQLDHGGEADAVRAEDRDRAVGIAHRCDAVALAVRPRQLAAEAAERRQHAGPCAGSSLSPSHRGSCRECRRPRSPRRWNGRGKA